MFTDLDISTMKQRPPFKISATLTVSKNVDASQVTVRWIIEGNNHFILAGEERYGKVINSQIEANQNEMPVKLTVFFNKQQLWTRNITLAELLDETGEM